MQKTYSVEGMHCAGCVQKIAAALQGFAKNIQVTLIPPQAVLSGEQLPSLDALNKAIANVGEYNLKNDLEAEIPVIPQSQQISWLKIYYPLLLIIGFIAVTSCKNAENINAWMLHFMAGFFIVFGFFKFLDLRGFRDAYVAYDLLAARWKNYGLIYPFLEVGLGLSFLFNIAPHVILWASLILMSFSSLGVIQALHKKQKIRCACLGTVLNLPMSTITLVEDLGMVAMSIFMLMTAL